jgi:hypothetical protein
VGLNQKRRDNEAVAYTPAFGLSTPTKNGREIVLGSGGPGAWLPLRVGSNYVTQVLEVRERGNTRLEPERVVLSLGPKTSSRIPTLRPGMTVRLLTATSPGLAGTDTAMGGNWILVKEGKPNPALSLARRDPRTAIGWNQRHLFLVVVDGRQSGLSAGMTPSELAEYLAGLGCQNAMNLDGGGSSTLWLEGQVRNSPSEGIQRRVANALLVVKPPIASPKPTPARP